MPDFLTGLHGALVTVLLCALLFIDEAGVPLPFAPNEVLLIIAGLLIASGSLPWFAIYPLAVLAILLGALTGYSWANHVGPEQLRSIAGRLRALRPYDKATERMRDANVRAIAVTRCIPGIRVYATLVAGAADVPLRTFMRASIPAALVWTAVMLGLGIVVGAPAAQFFTSIEKLALSGGILVLTGIVAYRAARMAPRAWSDEAPFAGITTWHRVVLAFLLDAGVVAVIAAGIDRITRFVLQFRLASFTIASEYDFAIILAAIAVAYVIASRHGQRGETAGERLFDVSYVHIGRSKTPPEGALDDYPTP